MIGLMFHYEEASFVTVPYSLWDDIAFSWGFDKLIIVDVDNIFPKRVRETTFLTLEEAMEAYSGFQFIYLMPKNSIPKGMGYEFLHEFTHPMDNVIYVLGPDVGLKSKDLNMDNDSKLLTIMTERGNGAEHALWTIEVAMFIVYDRWFKRWQLQQ